MASPCEVMVLTKNKKRAEQVFQVALAEAKRVEQKFSRYRDDNIMARINHSQGVPIEVDTETAKLLDYAHELYTLSGGLFDITSGVLRRAWHFDGKHDVPTMQQIEALLPWIGLEKVTWHPPTITLPARMEIDFGGIGKEYAVDRAASLIEEHVQVEAVLLNFGGDIRACGAQGRHWEIAVDDPLMSGRRFAGHIQVRRGAVATSGDAKRHILKDGIRYCHILNPKTGWPALGAPHSVTVCAPTCLEAGMLCTIAMLHGADAESFLRNQAVDYWIF